MSNMALPTYNIDKWNSYTPTEAEGQTTSETTWTDEGIINLGTRQRVVYKEPLDLENKVYTIYAYTTTIWQRIGLIPYTNTEMGSRTFYKTLYSYGESSITAGVQKYKIYLENESIWHEWNNQRQKIVTTYNPSTNYYFHTYSASTNEKILAIIEEDV